MNCMKTRTVRKKSKKIVQKQKVVRVLAQGTFDVLHVGHIRYLEFAKQCGEKLIVIVARDSSVKRIKHHAPVFPERVRLQMVRALKAVDDATLGGKGDMLDKVVQLRPDLIVLGYDQMVNEKELQEKLAARGVFCKIIRAPAHAPHIHKSSKWKSRITSEKVALKQKK